MTSPTTAEHLRLRDSEGRHADWKAWGTYLSERAWGTVREDYSASGDAWDYFSHDQARSRAYRWNEDGIGGFCNRFQNLCMAAAFWNGRDPILKERLFGLTNHQGNRGEDVKEYYFYLDGVPSHSYMKMLYKYPQVEYPYRDLIRTSYMRARSEPEYELIDALRDAWTTGRYFDIFIEYAKYDQDDIACRITAINRADTAAPLTILPHLWYRNTWSWGHRHERPIITARGTNAAYTDHRHIGARHWYVHSDDAPAQLLFTENETNNERLFNYPNATPSVKDAFHDAIIHGRYDGVHPDARGSKAAAAFTTQVPAGGAFTVYTRFTRNDEARPFVNADAIFDLRIREADEFYDAIQRPDLEADARRVQRQAFAGLMWSKQFYHYSVDLWQTGDPAQPEPPAERRAGRNHEWAHLYCLDVLSMPDTWEYPWFAAWDLAFHMLPTAMLDPEWAKRQLVLLLREWYMHPNGQIPAYEWEFGDTNPPVHAWATWQVYKLTGGTDTDFLERVFQKLLLNFTWWVNRKDRDGKNVFQGGFLGLDNIGVFDRSRTFDDGTYFEQADGTGWMAMYCLNMLTIALELARTRPIYEDIATKFFEHFVYIANAFFTMSGTGASLWDEGDGFFYDLLHTSAGTYHRLRTRSFVGMIPMLAVGILDADTLEKLPRFRRRMEWFIQYRPKLIANIAPLLPNAAGVRLLSVVNRDKLERILEYAFDESEFLSAYGLRSLSRYHAKHPFRLQFDGELHTVRYEPGEAATNLYGGNSNWRGPIWFPINYLIIEALRTYHQFYGDDFTVEVPRGSGVRMTLAEAADLLGRRLAAIFARDENEARPVFGGEAFFQSDPHWRDHIPFYEYFHGDTGAGLGASHQTGWTALVANLIQDCTR
jgi:hypothetical protein